MANSFEIVSYKQTIMSMLIHNSRIAELINDPDIEEVEELIGTHLFNFIRIPQSIEEENTYIAYEVAIPNVVNSNTTWFKKLTLTFYVITHERTMPTDEGGTRIDLLAAELDQMSTGFKGLGTQPLELVSNTSNGISVKHRCRILTFKAEDWIDTHCNNEFDE